MSVSFLQKCYEVSLFHPLGHVEAGATLNPLVFADNAVAVGVGGIVAVALDLLDGVFLHQHLHKLIGRFLGGSSECP